jgi:RNA polymerase sigma factor (sigma-70 family)
MAVVVGFGLLGFNLMPVSEHGADPRNIRALFYVGATGGLTDEQLLARFVDSERDTGELAFAELVARHGPMVLRVCRMILRDAHDAEDAFQATFLVLARRSRSIRERGSAASWLHGVARRVALSARSAAARRRAHERRAAEMPMPSSDDAGWNDLGDVLHQEIERLPEKYRKAIVLCELEGLTEGQAAQRLEWPIGTVRTRLRRGRERLRSGLLRRGVAPTAVLLGAVGSSDAASRSVPDLLARSTIEAVVQPAATKSVPAAVSALTAAVCRAMFLTKLTIPLVALLAVGTASLMAVQTLTFTRAKLKPIGSATGTTSARVPAEPAVPIASSPPNLQVSPPTVEILAKLQEPLDMVFPRETPLDDVLKYITRATKYGDRPSDPGIPIYVDPFGLQEAKKSLKSTVTINVTGVPLKVTLPRVLAQLGLAYLVGDGVLLISSSSRIDAEQARKVALTWDRSPRTAQALTKLDEPIAMSFPDETPLNEVLKYIKKATTTPSFSGIPIYVDPAALQEVDRSLRSTVKIDLQGVPLRTSLRLVAEQLRLAYYVNEGNVIVSSPKIIQERAETEESENKSKKDQHPTDREK